MNRKTRRMRKYLIVVACIALVLGVAIGGTVAWLADSSEKVENTFTPSTIDVTLTESKPTNKTAQMIPGAEIKKDPKVTVTNADVAAWVFVKVTESDNLDDFISYEIDAAWKVVPGYTAGDKECVYYCHVAKNANSTLSVLKGDVVNVLGTVTKDDMDTTKDFTEPKLSFEAFVIQSEHLVDSENKELGEDDIAAIWEMAN